MKVTRKRVQTLVLLGTLLGCSGRQPAAISALKSPAGEKEALMRDARETFLAIGGFLNAHKGRYPPISESSSLKPFLPTGSHADLFRFVQVAEGERGMLSDTLPPLGEIGHYVGKTGTALIDDAGQVYWWPKGQPRPREVFEPRR